MRLVDTHCHLDADEFDADRDAVIRRARDAGVQRQILPGVDAAGWPGLRRLCAAGSGLFPAYGLHPLFLDGHDHRHVDELRGWLGRERAVAVGECGLDFFVDGHDRERQLGFFEAQLRLARDFDLPVIVHARRAVDAVLAAIRRIGGLRGVVHSFSGSRQQAEQLAGQNFLLGLGGPVTYERAHRLRTLARELPLEWWLLESDAPDQPDAHIRGQRNEPARLPVIAQTLAELRGMEMTGVADATTRNAERLFGLEDRRA